MDTPGLPGAGCQNTTQFTVAASILYTRKKHSDLAPAERASCWPSTDARTGAVADAGPGPRLVTQLRQAALLCYLLLLLAEVEGSPQARIGTHRIRGQCLTHPPLQQTRNQQWYPIGSW